jgi:Zn-dependent M28 family amino/carboxypeptidase
LIHKKAAFLFITAMLFTSTIAPGAQARNLRFSGSTAYADVLKQMSFGPRVPNSSGILATAAYIRANLTSYGWSLRSQNFTYYNQLLKGTVKGSNLIATLPASQQNASALKIVLGAHYDTRPSADNPNSTLANPNLPVPGADDGASGVAALLELGRVYNANTWTAGLTMVFFDGEDSGLYSGVGWIQGSQYFVGSLNTTERSQIRVAIVLDMIGYSNLILKQEDLSDYALRNAIWSEGRALGYSQFIDTIQRAIIDDHKPFLDSGIRAVDIIDLDYPFWHTPYDTADKVSANSLEAVGRTMEDFILTGMIVSPGLPASLFIVLGTLIVFSGVAIVALLKARRARSSYGLSG